MYNKTMTGGRPTTDPKPRLIAVRLAKRQLDALQARCRREGVGLSEALRRCIDEWTAATASPRRRSPSPEERETFKQAFAALGRSNVRASRRRRSS
jgi:hypothetical protein